MGEDWTGKKEIDFEILSSSPEASAAVAARTANASAAVMDEGAGLGVTGILGDFFWILKGVSHLIVLSPTSSRPGRVREMNGRSSLLLFLLLLLLLFHYRPSL